jgi:hypothetical protein
VGSDYPRSEDLRNKIRKLAENKISADAFAKLDKLLGDCEQVTAQRNALIHHIWARKPDGKIERQRRKHQWRALPTIPEVKQLARDIEKLTSEIDSARRRGFLFVAMTETLTRPKP